ncbi:DNA polymerase theta subunit [Colletotrichum asianum]
MSFSSYLIFSCPLIRSFLGCACLIVICAKANKSDFAPALNRSEKWSNAADMTLHPHMLTKFDHASCETVAGLRKVLNRATRHIVLARNGVDRHFVAQVS